MLVKHLQIPPGEIYSTLNAAHPLTAAMMMFIAISLEIFKTRLDKVLCSLL